MKSHHRDHGASAVEYGLIVVGVAAVVTLIVFTLGLLMRDTYEESCDTIRGQAEQKTCLE